MQASIRVTDSYRYYVAWLLCGVYTISLMDRQLVAVLVEPIRTEFALQDWHMGVLSGLAFAAFYTTLGVPLARLADRNNRVNIITISLLVWSVFTGLTGIAKTFVHLLIARIGVAIGEAGRNPAAYLGGMLSDRLASRRHDSRYYLWIPALSLTFGFPLSQGVLLFDNTTIVIGGARCASKR